MSLNENCVPVVLACDSPSFVPCHFHCHACYLAACWCALNFPQQNRVNIHNGGYGSVRGDKRHDGEVNKVQNFTVEANK
jgi:hypothetical protein